MFIYFIGLLLSYWCIMFNTGRNKDPLGCCCVISSSGDPGISCVWISFLFCFLFFFRILGLDHVG